MTNKERQKSLDNQKQHDSELIGKDMSGKMFYCEVCPAQHLWSCTVDQAERESKCLCATAYNKLQRVKLK